MTATVNKYNLVACGVYLSFKDIINVTNPKTFSLFWSRQISKCTICNRCHLLSPIPQPPFFDIFELGLAGKQIVESSLRRGSFLSVCFETLGEIQLTLPGMRVLPVCPYQFASVVLSLEKRRWHLDLADIQSFFVLLD